MHSTGSFLYTVLERIRFLLDSPIQDAKYTNDYVVRHLITQGLVNILSRLNLNADNPIVLTHSVTFTTDEAFYQLPPNIGEVLRLVQLDDNADRVIADIKPRDRMHALGPKWAIEGNQLFIQPRNYADTFLVMYIPTGDFLPHYATDGTIVDNSDGDPITLTLTSSPTLGAVDQRPNAYAGATIRIISKGGTTIVEERTIASHDIANSQVTFRTKLDHHTDGASTTYEIAPPQVQALYTAIACDAAMTMAAAKDVTAKKMSFLQVEYRKAMKTIGDNLSNMENRTSTGWKKNTLDNPQQSLWVLVG